MSPLAIVQLIRNEVIFILAFLTNDGVIPFDFDEYYIVEKTNGLDTIGFTIPIKHPQFLMIDVETELTDTETGQRYIIKAIDENDTTASIKGELDLDEWRAGMLIDYQSEKLRAENVLAPVAPDGWTVSINVSSATTARASLAGGTPLDFVTEVCAVFGLSVRFDTKAKIAKLIDVNVFEPNGTYITDELNLRSRSVKSSSTDFVTRLYARGKDGLIFETDQGRDYVEDFSYSDKVVSAIWIDERYTDAQSLHDDAVKRLAQMAKPKRSYECSVVDLARSKQHFSGDNTNIYAHLRFDLFEVVTLLDTVRNTRLNHQVAQLKRYPKYPEKNEVTLSTVAVTIQSKVATAYDAVTSPNSTFKGSVNAIIDGASKTLQDSITGAKGGYVLINYGDDKKTAEILVMNTESVSTATKIMRLNQEGISFSENGYEGDFTTAIGIDGTLMADWIGAANINADKIKTGTLDASVVTIINLTVDKYESQSTDEDLLTLEDGTLSISKSDKKIVSLKSNNTKQSGEMSLQTHTDADVSCTTTIDAKGIVIGKTAGNGDTSIIGEIKLAKINGHMVAWKQVATVDGDTVFALCGESEETET